MAMTFVKSDKAKVIKEDLSAQESSDDSGLFSSSNSDDEGEPVKSEAIPSNYYDEFIGRDEFDEEMEFMKDILKADIIEEARKMIKSTTDQQVQEKVDSAQLNMATKL